MKQRGHFPGGGGRVLLQPVPACAYSYGGISLQKLWCLDAKTGWRRSQSFGRNWGLLAMGSWSSGLVVVGTTFGVRDRRVRDKVDSGKMVGSPGGTQAE